MLHQAGVAVLHGEANIDMHIDTPGYKRNSICVLDGHPKSAEKAIKRLFHIRQWHLKSAILSD